MQLNGTWKEGTQPGCGNTWNLAPHLIDQCMVLFGRPDSVMGLVQNVRQLGHSNLDDSASKNDIEIARIQLTHSYSLQFICTTLLPPGRLPAYCEGPFLPLLLNPYGSLSGATGEPTLNAVTMFKKGR
jgi:hypothetical protein